MLLTYTFNSYNLFHRACVTARNKNVLVKIIIYCYKK